MDKIDRLKQKPVEAATNDKVSKGAEFDKKWKNVIIYFYCKTEFFLFKGMSLCQSLNNTVPKFHPNLSSKKNLPL